MEGTSARFLTVAVVVPFHSKANMSGGGSILSKPARLLIRTCADTPVNATHVIRVFIVRRADP